VSKPWTGGRSWVERLVMTLARPFRFESAARTHVGRVRDHNEDAFLDRSDIGLWAVADGMGGHEAGEVASGLIVDTLDRLEPALAFEARIEALADGLDQVNRTLVAQGDRLEPRSVIGSTVVALLADRDRFACMWAGDSRCYRLRGGALERLSHDHSLVQEMVDSGELTPAAAKTHRRANVITRAVGVHFTLALDLRQGEVVPGDLFLLCSDGLTGMVEDPEIAELMQGQDLEAAADRLIQTTLDRGARDNVTVVLVRPLAQPGPRTTG
jgi:serine/threonine protein phosphatase PrpC